MKQFEVMRKWRKKLGIETFRQVTHFPWSCHIYFLCQKCSSIGWSFVPTPSISVCPEHHLPLLFPYKSLDSFPACVSELFYRLLFIIENSHSFAILWSTHFLLLVCLCSTKLAPGCVSQPLITNRRIRAMLALVTWIIQLVTEQKINIRPGDLQIPPIWPGQIPNKAYLCCNVWALGMCGAVDKGIDS